MDKLSLPGLSIIHDYPEAGTVNENYPHIPRYSKHKPEDPYKFYAIVVHHTAGPSYSGAKDTAHNRPRIHPVTGKGYYAGYHFIVDKDGTIYQVAPMSVRTNHTKSEKGSPYTNAESIGVSLVGYGKQPWEGAQREQALKLIAGLMNNYKIPIGNIKGHAETQSNKERHEGIWIHEAIKNGELQKHLGKDKSDYQFHGSGYFDRNSFAKQLSDDKELKEDLLLLTTLEVGTTNQKAQMALIETLFNRLNAHKSRLGDSIRKEIWVEDYYQPRMEGKLSSKKLNEKDRSLVEGALQAVLKGSNESNFGTHNLEAGDPVEDRDLSNGKGRETIRINYGGGTEVFYNKISTTKEGEVRHGKKYIQEEIDWLNSVGGGGGSGVTPSSFQSSGTGSSNFMQSFSSGQGIGGLLGGLLGSGIGSGAISTGSIASAISSGLPSALASLPSASAISTGIAQSIQTGQGFAPFTSAVQSIASADSVVGRLTAIGKVATDYEAEIKALYPDLKDMDLKSIVPSIIEFGESESPRDRLIKALEFAEETGIGLEQFDDLSISGKSLRDMIKDPTSIPEIKDKRGGLAVPGAKLDNYLRDLLQSDDVSVQKEAIEKLENSIIGNQIKESQIKTLLTGSLEDIARTPLISELFGGSLTDILTGESSLVTQTLTDLGAAQISKYTGLEGDTSKTLLAGGTSEEIKKMRSEVGGMALDQYIETNPTLKTIIEWFTQNQDIITLLGTAGAFAGLSSLLGGGMLGGLAAGAGGMFAARMVMGEEGFEKLQGQLKQVTAPAFDLLSGMLEEGGLLSGFDNFPLIKNILSGLLDVGRENPLAAMSLASGNIGLTAGLLFGAGGLDISLLDKKTNPEDLAHNLAGIDPLRAASAIEVAQRETGGDPRAGPTGYGNQDNELAGQTRGKASQGFGVPELYVAVDTSYTNDYSWTGTGVQASIA